MNDRYQDRVFLTKVDHDRIDRERRTKRLDMLAQNLALAGALCQSYKLGFYACSCDQGPRGHEWSPGMGCSPEDIAEREWNHDAHRFVPDTLPALYGGPGIACKECGYPEGGYLHRMCPECWEIDGHGEDCSFNAGGLWC